MKILVTGTAGFIGARLAENNAKTAELELVYEKYNLQYNLTLIEFYCGK